MDSFAAAITREPQRTPSALLRRWFDEVWNAGRTETIDELLPPHMALWGIGRPDVCSTGSADFKQFYHAMRAACSEIHVHIDQLVEEGDTAFARWTITMKHTGDGLGVPPTGKTISLCGMSALRARNGEVMEGWNNWDQIGMVRQLGLLHGPAAELFR
jgi:steroid delta-isomerase-like uncharacterized protein